MTYNVVRTVLGNFKTKWDIFTSFVAVSEDINFSTAKESFWAEVYQSMTWPCM